MTKVVDFVTDNSGKIAAVVLFIVVLYLKSIFITTSDHKAIQKIDNEKIEVLTQTVIELNTVNASQEHRILDLENKLTDVYNRQEKKVKIQNELKEEIDHIENKQIELLKDIEYLKEK